MAKGNGGCDNNSGRDANNSSYDYCHENDGGDRRTLEMHNDTLWRDPEIADRYLPQQQHVQIYAQQNAVLDPLSPFPIVPFFRAVLLPCSC